MGCIVSAEDYTYRVFWSEEDGAFVGTVAEFPSFSCIEDAQFDAFSGIIALVKDVLDDMGSSQEEPPLPLGKKRYSGKIALRMTPEQHRLLAMEAAAQGVSLNHLITSRL